MYFNHHPNVALMLTNEAIRQENMLVEESETSEEKEEDKEENDIYLRRARALIFIGEDEELYRQIKLEERANRANSPIAATVIKTGINEEGEYDLKSQDVEYFDEPDEKILVKPVHEVKTIPATRPVDVVKPVLADDYLNEQSENDSNKQSENHSKESDLSINLSDKTDIKESEPIKEPVKPEGFIFRKKESKPLDKIKPGEPLPNPLKGPAPSNKKPVDFDFDSSDKDDFDF